MENPSGLLSAALARLLVTAGLALSAWLLSATVSSAATTAEGSCNSCPGNGHTSSEPATEDEQRGSVDSTGADDPVQTEDSTQPDQPAPAEDSVQPDGSTEPHESTRPEMTPERGDDETTKPDPQAGSACCPGAERHAEPSDPSSSQDPEPSPSGAESHIQTGSPVQPEPQPEPVPERLPRATLLGTVTGTVKHVFHTVTGTVGPVTDTVGTVVRPIGELTRPETGPSGGILPDVGSLLPGLLPIDLMPGTEVVPSAQVPGTGQRDPRPFTPPAPLSPRTGWASSTVFDRTTTTPATGMSDPNDADADTDLGSGSSGGTGTMPAAPVSSGVAVNCGTTSPGGATGGRGEQGILTFAASLTQLRMIGVGRDHDVVSAGREAGLPVASPD